MGPNDQHLTRPQRESTQRLEEDRGHNKELKPGQIHRHGPVRESRPKNPAINPVARRPKCRPTKTPQTTVHGDGQGTRQGPAAKAPLIDTGLREPCPRDPAINPKLYHRRRVKGFRRGQGKHQEPEARANITDTGLQERQGPRFQ